MAKETVKVKFLKTWAHPGYGCHQSDTEAEFPADVAKRLIADEAAISLDQAPAKSKPSKRSAAADIEQDDSPELELPDDVETEDASNDEEVSPPPSESAASSASTPKGPKRKLGLKK